MRILGIDLAYNHAGWALMEEPKKKTNKLKLIDKDMIMVDYKLKLNMAQKLVFMSKELFKVIRKHKPDVVVLEDTFTGANAEVTAKLNNAKGMALVLIYNLMKKEPICATAATVRSCIGIKSKEDVFNHYQKMYKLINDFKKYNDLSDAIALAYYYYYKENNLCAEKKTKPRKKK
jgi:Holliday junction resolvasome RuvABC endonuclease subunit